MESLYFAHEQPTALAPFALAKSVGHRQGLLVLSPGEGPDAGAPRRLHLTSRAGESPPERRGAGSSREPSVPAGGQSQQRPRKGPHERIAGHGARAHTGPGTVPESTLGTLAGYFGGPEPLGDLASLMRGKGTHSAPRRRA